MALVSFTVQDLETGTKVFVSQGSEGLAIQQVGLLLRDSPDFRTAFNQHLADFDGQAFFWEVRPASTNLADEPWEHVLINAPGLLRQRARPDAFRDYFGDAAHVVSFPSLRGDAELVVPCPTPKGPGYAHLAEFARLGPAVQRDALWQTVGKVLIARLNLGHVFWLSTAGLGVPWLHVRFDSRPKYYRHAPYRIAPPNCQSPADRRCNTG